MTLFEMIWRGHGCVITALKKVRKQPSNNHPARLQMGGQTKVGKEMTFPRLLLELVTKERLEPRFPDLSQHDTHW